jgi:hypothetical protein
MTVIDDTIPCIDTVLRNDSTERNETPASANDYQSSESPCGELATNERDCGNDSIVEKQCAT